MSYSPGDRWKPTAAWLNAVNRMLSAFVGRTGGGGMYSAPPNGAQKLQVYNPGSSALVAGQAVQFTSGAFVDGMIPCTALSSTDARWGVLTTYLAPGQGGGCIIGGPVKVDRITGSSGECAYPVTGSGAVVSGAQVWSRGAAGVPLFGGTSSGGVVVLGNSESINIGAVITAPAGGFGAGVANSIAPNSDGTYEIVSGATIGWINLCL